MKDQSGESDSGWSFSEKQIDKINQNTFLCKMSIY